MCTALALYASASSAQRAPDTAARISAALEMRRAGHDLDALRALEAIYRDDPRPTVLAQIALAEHALGRWTDAEQHLNEALSASSDPWIRSRRPALDLASQEIVRHLGRLDVVCNVASAEVLVDGRPRGRTPLAQPLRVEAGARNVEVRAEGYAPARRSVEVTGGDAAPARVSVGLVASLPTAAPIAVVAPPAARSEGASRPPTLRYVGVGLAVAGAASLVFSGVQLASNLSRQSDTEGATATSPAELGAWARYASQQTASGAATADVVCERARGDAASADAAQVRTLCDDQSRAATMALAFGIAGGALSIAGAALIVVGGARTSARASAWSVTPLAGAGLGGLAVRGQF